MAANCTPSNPDVSGVGVRAAIYAQNLTCFLPVIVHLWDRKISRDELKGVKDQSIGMLAVAFAILFTTIILAKGAGGDQKITSYHAAVVLDLSWMNNTSTWIWFILYVHYRTKRDDRRAGANWSDWRDALLEPVQRLLGRNEGAGASVSIVERIRPLPQGIRRITWQRIWGIAHRIWGITHRIWCFISEQPVLTLGSIHLSLMAAVGIWLWSDPSKFGLPLDTGCDPTLTVVGVPARFSSKPLRIVSLTMYSIVLIPGLNLIPPFVFFLTLHISYNWSREHHKLFWTWWDNTLDSILMPRKTSPSTDPERGGTSKPSAAAVSSGFAPSETSVSSPNTAPIDATAYPPSTSADSRAVAQPGISGTSPVLPIFNTVYPPSIAAVSNDVAEPGTSDSSPNTPLPIVNQAGSRAVVQPKTPHTAFLIVGLVSLVAINILFIVDIELTLRRNKGDQNVDDQWGFGQVLALLLLIIPLRDAWGALQDIREKLKGVQEQFEELLRRECQATPVVEELRRLINNGVNRSLWSADNRFGSALQLVAYYGKMGLVDFLLKEGIEDMPGVHFQTALQSAAARGHVLVVNFLLQSEKYVGRLDEVGGDYGTALCAACAKGNVEVVNALLQAGAMRNGDEAQLESGKHFGAPLHVAVLMENREMIELLIGDNPNDADCICTEGKI
ncbi:hypothetical protein B0H19DRAFT_1070864 [Mycena capillaripes]|nr:hypothetical protein B0H19DRAFT_1070864 [Mycena capillaripes]